MRLDSTFPRPPRSEVDADGIPEELTTLNQWVCWKHVWREGSKGKSGKWTKMPVQVDGTPADSTDSATWTNFDSVLAAYDANKHDGIGFVLTADDPYVCNDLDKCVQQDGSIHPRVRSYIDQYDSFTEWSQSNKGVHVWMKGHGHPERKRKGAFELYETERFIAMTGRTVPSTRNTIEERQDAIDAVAGSIFGETTSPEPQTATAARPDDIEVIRRAEGGSSGRVFKALIAGKWEPMYESQSEADTALAFYLAGAGADAVAIERIMRSTPLAREKWDTRRGSTTWLREQIDHALRERKPRVRDANGWPDSELPEIPWRNAAEFAGAKFERAAYVCAPYFVRSSTVELAGSIKAAGKTHMLLHFSKAVVSGE